MNKVAKAVALAAATVTICAPFPVQASGCWATRDVAAAKVRDLQTMLMVATLRCRAGGIDMSADYNNFVQANAAALTAMNGIIKAHFAEQGGQVQYDRFTTALANGYGADATGGDSCAEAAALSQQGAVAGSIGALLALADTRSPSLPGGPCEVTPAASPIPAIGAGVILASSQR